MNCSFCGTALSEGAAHCPSCGSSIAYRAQNGQAVQNTATPFSLQQSGKRQATDGYAPLQLPSSKLSSYKPANLPANNPVSTPPASNPSGSDSGSMPGIGPGSRLSHYSQASTLPSKLSDYKQSSIQRSKLSDYKTGANQNLKSPSTPDHAAPFPAQDASFLSLIPTIPVAPAPSSVQSAYSRTASAGSSAPNMAGIPGPVNPPSFIPAGRGYPPNPMPSIRAPSMNMPVTRQSKPKGWLIVGIAVLLLIVCVGAASFFFLQRTNNAKQVASVTKTVATPVPTVAPIHGPSGNISVPAISALFSNPQTAAAIDENDKAVQTTSTFTTGKTVYVTFNLDSKSQKGYVRARWYKGKQLFREVDFAHDPGKTNGYFSIVYDAPTTDGSVELYWSTTANFSDAKLARVAHFTVTQ